MASIARDRPAYDVFIGTIAAVVALGLIPSTLALLFCIAGLGWDFIQAPIGMKAAPRTMFGAAGLWFIFPVFVLWAAFFAASVLLWLFNKRMRARNEI
jgi:hypothetical protein